jgi:hypothetical protein
MNAASRYRKIAAELRAKALKAPTDSAAAQYDALAQAYARLADQADENERADVWAEFGRKPRLGEGEGA